LQYNQVGDKRQRMPYALGFYLYLFVTGVVVTALAVWLAPFGLLVNLTLAFSAAYLWIIVGRWLFNKPEWVVTRWNKS
jgi:hypothetical protein